MSEVRCLPGPTEILRLADESFKALLGEYLRPATTKILFG